MKITPVVGIQQKNKGAISRALDSFRRAVMGPKNLEVGFPSGKVPGDIAMRAMWMEFGTSRGIPERPFMRITFRKHEGKYKQVMRSTAKGIFQGRALRGELTRLGIMAAGDIQQTIGSNLPPPNKPATIRRKGSSKTLIGTGQMRQAVTYEVK